MVITSSINITDNLSLKLINLLVASSVTVIRVLLFQTLVVVVVEYYCGKYHHQLFQVNFLTRELNHK